MNTKKLQFEYIYYSNLESLQMEYQINVFNFLHSLNYEYPSFDKWYRSLFNNDYSIKNDREIILCKYGESIVGITILKKTEYEDKICTLRVGEGFQKNGVGRKLLELGINYMENDKPIISLDKRREHEFEKLLKHYGFKLEQEKPRYYKLFSTELVYNGELTSKKVASLGNKELGLLTLPPPHKYIGCYI